MYLILIDSIYTWIYDPFNLKTMTKMFDFKSFVRRFFRILVKASLLEVEQTFALSFFLENYCKTPKGNPQYLSIYFDNVCYSVLQSSTDRRAFSHGFLFRQFSNK